MKLHADFLPPDMSQLVRWWVPVRSGKNWFYYSAADTLPPGVTNTPLIYVDPYLRPIVSALNDVGIPTFASCQGHFWTWEEFVVLYDQLVFDRSLIRGEGLLVRDLISDQVIMHQDPTYDIPARDRMWAELKSFEGFGHFAFGVSSLSGVLSLIRAISFTTTKLAFSSRPNMTVVNVYVPSTPATQDAIWSSLTTKILAEIPALKDYKPDNLHNKILNLSTLAPWVYWLSVINVGFSELLSLFLFYVAGTSLFAHSWIKLALVVLAIIVGSAGLLRFYRRQTLIEDLAKKER